MCVYFTEVCDKLFELGFVGRKVETVFKLPFGAYCYQVREEYEFRHDLLNHSYSWIPFKLLITTERDTLEGGEFNHFSFCVDGSRVALVEYELGGNHITEHLTEGINKALNLLFNTTHELVLKDKLGKI